MNKIYKVIWSKAKQCYVVVSEIARNTTKGRGRRARQLALAAIVGIGVAASTGIGVVHAEEYATEGYVDSKVAEEASARDTAIQEVVNGAVADAKTAADNAQSAANNAQTAANNAQNTADNAQTAANDAQMAANNAQTAADNAQNTANDAQTAANDAAVAAGNAQIAADNAQSTANDNAAAINDMSNTVASHTNTLGDLSARLDSLDDPNGGKIATLEGTLNTVSNDVGDIKDNLIGTWVNGNYIATNKTIYENMTALDTQVKTNEDAIAQIKDVTDDTSIAAKLQGLTMDVDQIDSKIGGVLNIPEGKTILSMIGDNTTAIEEMKDTTKEGSLAKQIADEVTRAKEEEGKLSQAVADEKTRAEGAEKTLTDNLTAEVTRAQEAEQAINDVIGTRSNGNYITETATISENIAALDTKMGTLAGGHYITADSVADSLTGLDNKLFDVASKGHIFVADNGSKEVPLGNSFDIKAEGAAGNIHSNITSTGLQITMDKNPTFTSVSTTDPNGGAPITMDKDGFHANTVHLTTDGLNLGNKQLSGLADGTKDNDAVTYGQFKKNVYTFQAARPNQKLNVTTQITENGRVITLDWEDKDTTYSGGTGIEVVGTKINQKYDNRYFSINGANELALANVLSWDATEGEDGLKIDARPNVKKISGLSNIDINTAAAGSSLAATEAQLVGLKNMGWIVKDRTGVGSENEEAVTVALGSTLQIVGADSNITTDVSKVDDKNANGAVVGQHAEMAIKLSQDVKLNTVEAKTSITTPLVTANTVEGLDNKTFWATPETVAGITVTNEDKAGTYLPSISNFATSDKAASEAQLYNAVKNLDAADRYLENGHYDATSKTLYLDMHNAAGLQIDMKDFEDVIAGYVKANPKIDKDRDNDHNAYNWTITQTHQVAKVDAEGKIIYDDKGNPVMEEVVEWHFDNTTLATEASTRTTSEGGSDYIRSGEKASAAVSSDFGKDYVIMDTAGNSVTITDIAKGSKLEEVSGRVDVNAGDIADIKKGFKITAGSNQGVITPGDRLTLISNTGIDTKIVDGQEVKSPVTNSNIIVSLDAHEGYGVFDVSMKDNPEFRAITVGEPGTAAKIVLDQNGLKFGDGVYLTSSGLSAAGHTITEVGLPDSKDLNKDSKVAANVGYVYEAVQGVDEGFSVNGQKVNLAAKGTENVQLNGDKNISIGASGAGNGVNVSVALKDTVQLNTALEVGQATAQNPNAPVIRIKNTGEITGLVHHTWDINMPNNVPYDGYKADKAATEGQLRDITVGLIEAGLDFVGDNGVEKKVHKNLGQQMSVVGGAKGALSEGNIGVNTKDGKLFVQLAKNVDLTADGSLTAGNSVVNTNGVEVSSGNGNGKVVTNYTAKGVVVHQSVDSKNAGKTDMSFTDTLVDVGKNQIKNVASGIDGITYAVTADNNGANIGDIKALTTDVVAANDNILVDIEETVEGKKTAIITLNDVVNMGSGTKQITIDGDKREITGLSNTTWNPSATYNAGRAATEEQLKAVVTGTGTGAVGGWGLSDNAGAVVKQDIGKTLAVKGEAINGHNNVTTKVNTNAQGLGVEISLNNKVVLGEGEKVVTMDGTTGQITAGTGAKRVLIDGTKNQIVTGDVSVDGTAGAAQVKAGDVVINGTTGAATIKGLSNKTWDPANFVTGQAATEDQLKAALEQDTDYKLVKNPDATSGAYKVTSNKIELKVQDQKHTANVDTVVIEDVASAADLDKVAKDYVKNVKVEGNKLTATQIVNGETKTVDFEKVDSSIKKGTYDVVKGNDGKNTVTLKKVDIDGNEIAGEDVIISGIASSTDLANATLAYKANGANAQTVKLTDGLNFTNGDNTTAAVDANGVVKFSLNKNVDLTAAGSLQVGTAKLETGKATIDKVTVNGTAGTVNGLTNLTWTPGSIVSGQAATEDQLQAAIKGKGDDAVGGWGLSDNAGAVVKQDIGETLAVKGAAVNGHNNVTTAVNNNAQGLGIEISLNDKLVLGSGTTVVTVDGTTGMITAGTDAKRVLLDGSKNQIATGDVNIDGTAGAAQVKAGDVVINGTTGAATIKGLSNKTWDPANFVTGQAATEDQLKAALEQDTDYKLVKNPDATSGAYKVTSNKIELKVQDQKHTANVDTVVIEDVASAADLDKVAKDYVKNVKVEGNKLTATQIVNGETKTVDFEKVDSSIKKGTYDVVKGNDGKNTVTLKKVDIDGNEIAGEDVIITGIASTSDLQNTKLAYRANKGEAKEVLLTDGLDFTNGTNTTAAIDANGVVQFNLNQDVVLGENMVTLKGSDGTINAATKISVGTTGNAWIDNLGNAKFGKVEIGAKGAISNDNILLNNDGSATIGIVEIGANGTISNDKVTLNNDGSATIGKVNITADGAISNDKASMGADGTIKNENVTLNNDGTATFGTGNNQVAIDGVNGTIETGTVKLDAAGTAAIGQNINLDGAAGTGNIANIKFNQDADKDTNTQHASTITGLSNTTWDQKGTYTAGRAATEEQLQAAVGQVTTSGLDFVGDDGEVHRNLGTKLNIVGNADTNNLTDKNIGVVATTDNDGNATLTIGLAKDIKVNSVDVGDGKTVLNSDGSATIGQVEISAAGDISNGTATIGANGDISNDKVTIGNNGDITNDKVTIGNDGTISNDKTTLNNDGSATIGKVEISAEGDISNGTATIGANGDITNDKVTIGNNGDITNDKVTIGNDGTISNDNITLNNDGSATIGKVEISADGDITNGTATIGANGDITNDKVTIGNNGDITNDKVTIGNDGTISNDNITLNNDGSATIGKVEISADGDITNGTATIGANGDISNDKVTIGNDGNISNDKVTIGNNGDITNDKVTIGNDGTISNDKVTLNNDGTATIGNVAINGDGENATINGLTNKTWDPDNFVSGQGASEDQLKAVWDKAIQHTTVSGDEVNIHINPSTNPDGSENYEVVLDKDIKVDSVNVGDGTTMLNKDGSATIGKVDISVDGDITNGTAAIGADGTISNDNTILNNDGSATIGKVEISANGDISNDKVSIGNDGTIKNDNITLNNDGSASLAGGNFQVAANGDIDSTYDGGTLKADGNGFAVTHGDSAMTLDNQGTTFENGEDNGSTNINGSIITAGDVIIDGTDKTVDAGNVKLDGAKGVVSLTGADGAKADVTVAKGANNLAGDETTRITYGDSQVATMADGLTFKDDAGNTVSKKLNETVAVTGDANITTVRNDNGIQVTLNKELVGLEKVEVGDVTIDKTSIKLGDTTIDGTSVTTNTVNSKEVKADNVTVNKEIKVGDKTTINGDTVTTENVNATTVKAGDTTINNDGMTIKGKDGKDGITITKEKVDVGGNKIENVAPGEVSKDSTDAVNGSQLFETNQKVNKIGNRINKLGAQSAALAALHPLDFDPDEKLTFSAGVGHYHGSTAGAIGAFYRPDEKTMFSVSGTMAEHDNMINAGVSFALDRTPHQTNSKTAMAKDILELSAKVAVLQQQNAELMDAMRKSQGNMNRIRIEFNDLPEGHWAYNYVQTLAERGYLEGYPDGGYKGNRTLTRYEFAAALYRALVNGAPVDADMGRGMDEFGKELDNVAKAARFRVDRVAGEDNDRNKIERVRTNDKSDKANNDYRDVYGSKIEAPAK